MSWRAMLGRWRRRAGRRWECGVCGRKWRFNELRGGGFKGVLCPVCGGPVKLEGSWPAR